MDIQGWLQGTAYRAPPNPSDEPDALNFIQAAHGADATRASRYHRERQRSATDSSIIAPQQKTSHRSKVSDELTGVSRGRHVHKHPSRSESASRGGSSRPTFQEHGGNARIEQPDSKTYERRARHKTKPDRYGPKTTKRDKRRRHGSLDEHKSKRKSRGFHRDGDGKRTESLVQGFRLKNGPSNSRLTLNPDVSAGMFRHGRASAQMVGRSNGLPDLAFNELKFLRDTSEHQDEQHLHRGNMRKSSKEGKKREAEREEISAYFGHRNQRLETTPKRPTKRVPNLTIDGDMLTDHEDVRETGSNRKLPEGELPAFPYIGFGSTGTISKGSKPLPSSITSYLTWSKSGDGLATSGKRKPAIETPLEAGQLSMAKPAHARRSRRDIQKVTANDTAEGQSKDRDNVSKLWGATPVRVRVPAEINVYTDSGIIESHPSTDMRSKYQTLPAEQLKEISPNERKRTHADNDAETISLDDKSFHTSDILKIRTRLQSLAESLPLEAKSTLSHPHDKENVPPPSSSSPTAKIFRTAHGAMVQHQLEMSLQSPLRIQPSTPFDVVRREHPSYLPTFEHGSGNPAEKSFEHFTAMNSAPAASHHVEQQVWQDMHDAYGEEVEPENVEKLDTYVVDRPQHQSIGFEASDPRYAFVYSTPGIRSNARSMSRQDYRPSTRERDTPWSRSDVATTRRGTSSHNTLTGQDVSDGEDQVVGHEFEDGLQGFWRPNRLY